MTAMMPISPPAKRTACARLFLLLPLVLVAACTSTRLEEAMPATDQTSTVAAREDDATVARSESLQQMTQDERDAYLASVESARASQQSAGPGRQGVPASQLRNLARNHGEEALKEIEED